MLTTTVVSIVAIILSSFSFGWQIFTYWDLRRNKIKITTELEYKEGVRFNAIQDCFIRFYIFNTGRKKVLITNITPEYIVKEKKEILAHHFIDGFDIEYPISIEVDGHYLQNILIQWEKKLEVLGFATNGIDRWKTDEYTALKVRIIVNDISGKSYVSQWVDYKDPLLKTQNA